MKLKGPMAACLVGVCLLLWGMYQVAATRRVLARAVPATGTVYWRDRTYLQVQIADAEGITRIIPVDHPVLSLPGEYRVGATVKILYDPHGAYTPSDPGYRLLFTERGRVASPLHLWAPSVFYCSLGLLALIAAVFFTAAPDKFQLDVRVNTVR